MRLTGFGLSLTCLLVTSYIGRANPLLPTDERLTASEEKLIRASVEDKGPRTAGRSADNPFHRILVIPKAVKESFERKPRATVRVLLTIVENGAAWRSIHAGACITALLLSPEAAALVLPTTDDKWDEVIGGLNTDTRRESCRKNCIVLIINHELKAPAKKKD